MNKNNEPLSPGTYDAWKIKPPCEMESTGYECEHRCPYYHSDCWGDDEGEED